jgi:hypothetical protein
MAIIRADVASRRSRISNGQKSQSLPFIVPFIIKDRDLFRKNNQNLKNKLKLKLSLYKKVALKMNCYSTFVV